MPDLMKGMRRVAPGLLLVVTIALAARFVASQYGGPVMLLALLLGVAFNFLADETRCAPGINFASRDVLKAGVAMLGAALTFADATALGIEALAIIAVAVIGTLAGGILLARLAGLDLPHAVLSAGAVAICGASAAMAIAAVLPRTADSERRTVIIVAGVTSLSTLAMILYPSIALAIGMSDARAGLFIGASIHDVAQVVAGGHIVSDEAGAVSAVVKLVRVIFLAPVILLTALMFRRKTGAAGARPPLLPLFVIGFFTVMAANSFGMVPPQAAAAMTELSRWCLVIAVAALGMKMSVSEVLGTGARPFAVLTAQTLLMLGLVLGAMAMMPGLAAFLLR